MDFKQLAYFCAIVEEGNITAAAKRLHISQPPLSYQLMQLEAELGVVLLERGARKARLTDAGRVLYERAQNILTLTSNAKQEMLALGAGSRGTLRLGTISSSGAVLLGGRVRAFHNRFPDVRFEIHEGNTFELIDLLQDGVIDLAIVRTPFRAPGCERIELAAEPMVYAAQGSFFDNKNAPSLPLGALQGKPLVIYRRFEQLICETLRAEQIEPDILCLNDDARTSLMWASAGLGVAIVPESISTIFGGKRGFLCKKIDDPRLETKITAIWKKDSYLSRIAEGFLSFFAREDQNNHPVRGRKEEIK